jgi:hypothetical protein
MQENIEQLNISLEKLSHNTILLRRTATIFSKKIINDNYPQ